MSVPASILVHALAKRHSGDVFVAECKDGATQTRSHRRLDAWAMLRTWSPVTTFGYEVKVTRGDFLSDEKIPTYLPLCHHLYVVTPKGLLDKSELPEYVGLMELVGKDRIVIRHKAPYRAIEMGPLAMLMTYVLMCRTQVTRDRSDDPAVNRMEALRVWADRDDDKRQLSNLVNAKIRQKFADQENRMQEIDARVSRYASIERRLFELGFDPARPVTEWRVESRLREMAGNIAPAIQALSSAVRDCERSRDLLNRMIEPAVMHE